MGKICDIYDWDGKGELDLFFLGDIMYAMGYNTTKKVCVGLGQTDEEGKKFAKFDEIPKEDVQKMFAEICDPEDEDGLFPYMSFLDRLTGKAQGLFPPSTFIQVTTVSKILCFITKT